jgi:hypothetical protein
MKKYKLIKEYPGSPELGQIALPYTDSKNKVVHYVVDRNQKKDCDYIAILKKHVEDNPKYWEEVKDYMYMVLLKESSYHNTWETIRVSNEFSIDGENIKFFATKEDAEYFILYNKPCLSINEIGNNIPCTTLDRLIKTVKSKL